MWNAQKVANKEESLSNKQTQTEPSRQLSMFWQQFRIIASDPVGRVLLYRLLIEIGLVDSTGVSCFRHHLINVGWETITRVDKVTLTVKAEKDSQYSQSSSEISLDSLPLATFYNVEDPPAHKDGILDSQVVTHIVKNRVLIQPLAVPSRSWPLNDAVGLFHELLHWFHFLLDPKRYLGGADSAIKNSDLGNIVTVDGNTIVIGHYYYGALRNVYDSEEEEKAEVSAKTWYGSNNINYEEMLTILGGPPKDSYVFNNSITNYHEGDDLSENLFRLSLGLKMRFGHSCFAFFEDIGPVFLAICVIYVTAKLYGLENLFPPFGTSESDAWSTHSSKTIISFGLGQCTHLQD
jgi:hypothetical protein